MKADNIQRICGEVQTFNVNTDRESTIYIPSFVCNSTNYFRFFSIETNENRDLVPIPIIIALHGFSNDINKFLTSYTKLTTYSEQYGFIIIAPIGLDKSWNGIYCCGKSVQHNVNDLQFIKSVINSSISTITTIFKDIMTINSDNLQILVTGMSNGGFMSSEIAWAYALGEHGFPKITAFAPYLGFMYDIEDVKVQMNRNNNNNINNYKHISIPIFYQHGDKDIFVSINGCCHQHKCAGGLMIDSFKEECTSLYQQYQKWLDWNHCNKNITFNDIATIIRRRFQQKQNIQCATATQREHGCDEITKLCIFQGIGHDAHISKNIDDFQTNLLLFFYQIICLKYNGKWDIENNFNKPCICYNGKRSLFCMDITEFMQQNKNEQIKTVLPTGNPSISPTQHPSKSSTNVISEVNLTEMRKVAAMQHVNGLNDELDEIKENVEVEMVNEEDKEFDLMIIFWITVGCIGGVVVKQFASKLYQKYHS